MKCLIFPPFSTRPQIQKKKKKKRRFSFFSYGDMRMHARSDGYEEKERRRKKGRKIARTESKKLFSHSFSRRSLLAVSPSLFSLSLCSLSFALLLAHFFAAALLLLLLPASAPPKAAAAVGDTGNAPELELARMFPADAPRLIPPPTPPHPRRRTCLVFFFSTMVEIVLAKLQHPMKTMAAPATATPREPRRSEPALSWSSHPSGETATRSVALSICAPTATWAIWRPKRKG